MQRRGDPIRYNVVHIVSTTSARVAQPHDLDGSWFEGEYLVPSSFGVAIHVHKNVNAVLIDTVGCLTVVRYLYTKCPSLGHTMYTYRLSVPWKGQQSVQTPLELCV